ncbi:glucokinase [Sphingomonas sp.]|uniref:glucokinase n=1 Tax=Sphingomonas sp. TaxID=28214 RepID=UPI002FDAEA61
MPEQAIVADVGRTALRIGITDDACSLVSESVRTLSPEAEPTVSGAISGLAREHGLVGGGIPLAIAVSGMPRGDMISVTNGRWRISRPGLTAMLQREPLILNDFAANAWAISDMRVSFLEPLSAGQLDPQRPGTYCIIGIGSGLGVALMSRDASGRVTVVPTEAGHCAYPSGLTDVMAAASALPARAGFTSAESILSAGGLLAVYTACAASAGAKPSTSDPKEVIRRANGAVDEHAVTALKTWCSALWYYAGNMALAYGALDGVILTGSVSASLKKMLAREELARHFVVPSPYQKQLAMVPRALSTLLHPELAGAAVALRTMLTTH